MGGSGFLPRSLCDRVGGLEAVFLFDPVWEDPIVLIKGCENQEFWFVFPLPYRRFICA